MTHPHLLTAKDLIPVFVWAQTHRVTVGIETHRTIGHDSRDRDATPGRMFLRLVAVRGKDRADVTIPVDIGTTAEQLADQIAAGLTSLGQSIHLAADEYAERPGPATQAHFLPQSADRL